jgi:hypothetical protein
MIGVPSLSADLVEEVVASQSATGAFPSTMTEDGVARPDENGFVTAQVLRTLGPHTANPRLRRTVERALDFLEDCEDPNHAGTYRFWTDANRPPHVPVYPADADDTAVISLELFRHGRLDLGALRRTVLTALFPHRVPGHIKPPASWVVPGVFWTWLSDDFGYNVVDCAVNANVVALLAAAGLTHLPCYAAACSMIANGLAAAGGDEYLTRLLSPYYPHPGELSLAVNAAVAAGADRLRLCLPALEVWTVAVADRPVFCSAYGRVTWQAPLLQRLRLAVADKCCEVAG